MNKVRAKFSVTKVSEFGQSGKRLEIQKHIPAETAPDRRSMQVARYESTGVPVREVTMSAVWNDGISKENASFAEATPTGTMTFTVNNPALDETDFKPGQSYYIDFTPCE